MIFPLLVKLAKHLLTGRDVAIKVINKKEMSTTNLSKLMREVRIMKMLHHPHVGNSFVKIGRACFNSIFSSTLRSHRDARDTSPGDGICQWRRSLRLPCCAWKDEGKRSTCQIPSNRVRRPVHASEAYSTSRSQGDVLTLADLMTFFLLLKKSFN